MVAADSKNDDANALAVDDSTVKSAAETVFGTIQKVLPNDMFNVSLRDGRVLRCHIPGKLRMHLVRLLPGDKVEIAVSPYDVSRGKIMRRL